jgi:hypothetical protein
MAKHLSGCAAGLAILALLLLPVLPLRGADSPDVLLRDVTYTYDREPENDPDHTALLDATSPPTGPWSQTLTTDVTFDLRSTHELTRIEMDIYRGNLNWCLKDMTLFIAGRDGQFAEVSKVPTNWTCGFPGEPGPTSFAFTDINRPAQVFRIRFNNDGFYFGIDQIRIYARQPPRPVAVAAPPAAGADWGALTPYVLPETGDALAFRKGNFDRDPEEELLLANRYVKLVIEPSLGGVLASFRYRGMEFTQPKVPSAPGGGGGFLADNVNAQGGGDWWEAPFQYRLSEDTAERISLQLLAPGRTGPCAYLTLCKTITLYADRSEVQVDWDYQLSKAATAAIPFRFRNLSFVGTREGLAKSAHFSYFAPVDEGVARLDYAPPAPVETSWLNPTRGWIGVADSQQRTGVAFLLDYRYLKLFYSWGCSLHNGLPTLEWQLNDVTIPDGGSFKTSASIVPFAGMAQVAGAGGGVVASLEYAGKRVTATIVSGRTQDLAALLRIRVLPAGEWRTLAAGNLSLQADTALPFAADFAPAQDGTHVFSLVLQRDGREILNAERPQVFGKASGRYVLKPTEEGIVEEGARIKTSYTSMEYETPHVKWARPYHGGATKALVLVDGRYGREVIELAQRLDLRFDTTFLFPTDVRETLVDYYGRTSGGDLKAGLQRLFAENPDWEVIVLAGHMLRYFDPAQQADVLAKVRAGRGLVVVQPDASEPLPTLSPLQEEGAQIMGRWLRKQDHFITAGVPLEALPATPVVRYAAAPGAAVLATAANEEGDVPLVAAAEVGQGRVVAFAYRAGDSRSAKQFFGLTPYMADPQTGADFAPPPTFRYWEYHFALLAKAVLWAAHKEPSLRLERLEVGASGVPAGGEPPPRELPAGSAPDTLRLALDNAGEAQAVTVVVKAQDKYGHPLGGGEYPARVAAGRSEIAVPVQAVVCHGLSLFDVWLRDPQGRTIDWGSASCHVQRPVWLARVDDGRQDLFREGYRDGDTVHLDITLAGDLAAAGAAAGGPYRLVTRLRDGFGRVLAEMPTAVSGNREQVSLTLEHLISRFLAVEVELLRGEQRLDIHEFHRGVELPSAPKPHQGDPLYLGWNLTTCYGLNNYLVEPFLDLLAGYGFNAALIMGNDYTPTNVESAWRHNLPIEMRSGGIGPGTAMPGCDPEHLTLKYCMNNPEVRESGLNCIAALANVGVSRFQYGDEYVFAGSGQDYCFCRFCLEKMRRWLASRYADLEALNRNWGTAFKAWDEVVPLTLKECRARGDGNVASWVDHRRFNEVTAAEYFAMLGAQAEQIKGGARVGVSGNFGPGAYGGEDDWLLRRSWRQLEAYGAFDEFDCWQDETDLHILKYGTFADADLIRSNIWYHTFFGINGMAVCGTQRLPALDWSTSNCASGYRDTWRLLNRGIGRLLNEARRTTQAVALLYSRNDAARAAFLLEQEKLWQDTRYDLAVTLDNCGVDKGWLAYEQLEQGQTANLRVLWLPLACTLTDKETAALQAFVEGGGTLVGVLGSGIADADCRLRQQGSLDRVFGIQRSQISFARRQATAVPRRNSFGFSFPEIQVNTIELGLQATTAEVLADVTGERLPIAFANTCGKGRAIYLACDLPSSFIQVAAARGVGANAAVMSQAVAFITALHAAAGVNRILAIADEAGAYPPYLKLVHFRQGDISYYGIQRDNRQARLFARDAEKVRITFPAKGYVHELLGDRDLGHTDTVESVFTPTTVQLYSVLPYQVRGLSLDLPQERCAAGEVVRYEAKVDVAGKASTHTLRLNVLAPDGTESKAYSTNLSAPDGNVRGSFPLALNDTPGRWTLVLQDLTSGRKATRTLDVR